MDNGPPSPAPSNSTSVHAANVMRYELDTEVVYTDSNDQFRSSSVPIYQTATFKQDSLSQMGDYDYTRSGNPTRSHLERHMAKIMGASRALAVSSGMTALDVLTRLVRPGDEIVAGNDLYGGSNRLLKYLATNQSVIVHHIDTTDIAMIRSHINPRTRMVLLESPTNPLIKICDIQSVSAAVHELSDRALVVVDNTMMSPINMRPLLLGADVSYESATKFLCGHHDIMAGIIAVNDVKLGSDLYNVINANGCGLAPFDCWLLLRGVKTLSVRFEKQQSNAHLIATYLHGLGLKVRYPSIGPAAEIHSRIARGPGAVLSFETGDVAVSERIVEATNIWGISVSFGCVNSLISLPCKMSHASIDPKTRAERQFPEDLIRLCVGIENPNDLIADLNQALAKSGLISKQ